MNVHDSERLAGLLEAAGYRRAADGADADVVVFNTCAVRENADNKLYGNLSHLAPRKQADPDMQIAVGGCLAQKDRDAVLQRAPGSTSSSAPTTSARCRRCSSAPGTTRRPGRDRRGAARNSRPTLPAARESAYAAWVSISVGCNNTCTFCIVPALRGKEVDRRPGDVLAEVQSLVDQGVLEVTLLGQNVNAYGVVVRRPRHPATAAPSPSCCAPAGDIDGLERVRFTSPHPAEFTDDVIDAMAETPNVCPTLHMPLQSGSDRMLRAMRRSYRAERYLGIIDRVRAAIPHAAITTDIIVGFPGETEEDFQRHARRGGARTFASAFTFQYSKRPGTPAAELDGQVPKDVVDDRYRAADRAPGARSRWRRTRADRAARSNCWSPRVRVARTPARPVSGRARDGRLVHFAPGGSRRSGPATSSPRRSPAPHRIT